MPDVIVDGGVIHYETAGQGIPVVLLHGIGSNSRSWHYQLTALSQDYRVIAWDAPGYGRSSDIPADTPPSIGFYANRLRQMLEHLHLRSIVLLGHSMGGAIAQEFYRLYPDYVKALILADTRCVRSQEDLEERLQSIRTLTPSHLARERAPKLLSRNASPELISEATSIMSEVRPEGYEFAVVALATSDTREVMRNLRVPALLIWGSEDEITPVWDELPAGVQVEIIPSAGHLCYLEQPDRFNGVVKEFCLRTS